MFAGGCWAKAFEGTRARSSGQQRGDLASGHAACAVGPEVRESEVTFKCQNCWRNTAAGEPWPPDDLQAAMAVDPALCVFS